MKWLAFILGVILGATLLPAIARSQGYCWGNCPKGTPRVCISGDCPCFDEPYRTQCFAEQKAAFERANPPRGPIEGVCYASYNKWEREPGTGTQVLRVQAPVYTRVRYDETKPAGFTEVSTAWAEFLKANAASPPEGGGWNLSQICVALNKPKHQSEVNSWEKAQSQASYTRVFMPQFGVADTPEERALEAKFAAERQARLAEQKREAERQQRLADIKAADMARSRAESEFERRADVARAEAERQAKVDAIAQQIGPGKRAEAERLAKMNDELAAARPKPSAPRQCTSRSFSSTITATRASQQEARNSLASMVSRKGNCNITGSETALSIAAGGGANCSERTVLYIKPPPVGKCLACIEERYAIQLYGYVPGKGYPPPLKEWTCRQAVQCVAEKCGTGTSKVSQQ